MKDVGEASRLHGFTLISSEALPEIEGTAHTLVHDASGARLLYLENDDPNKAFAIAFKTPPADDTGVFHILEHSVLCGSDKFPVKEPFVNLLKSSMQTFLNALTFSDKTMYPVASTNERDLMNLADVYLDAVFHPLIYRKRTIFEQEGWHLEVSDGEGESSETPSVVCNGVVFNEMKGALSDPDDVLHDALMAALFPDTTYRFESGGTPACIPTLTYEAFLDSHRRHYRPDNSYLTLYGDLDPEKFLAFIDDEYLAPLAAQDSAASAGEAPPESVNALDVQDPVVCTGVKKRMATAPENAAAALGFVVGRTSDHMRMIAIDVLTDAILGSNEAPLKRALLDADLATDVLPSVSSSLVQPTLIVQLKGLKPGGVDRFRVELFKEAERLAAGGLDHGILAAALSRAEFLVREHDFGYADGVVYAVTAMTSWLYDEDASTAYLRYEEEFVRLRALLDEGYFENLLREVFLDNDHYAEVELVACSEGDADAPDAPPLPGADDPSAIDLDAIEENVAALRAAQEAPDDPSDVAKLPTLSISDIAEAPHEEPFEFDESASVPCLRHHVATHGIVYAYRYFDLTRLTFEELPYATVLAMVLGKLGTESHSAYELDVLVQGQLGNLSFAAEVYDHVRDRENPTPKFAAGSSALPGNVASLATLVDEVLLETDFSDHDKIRDVLAQRRVAMEQGLATSGHSVAMSRVASYCQPSAVVRDQLSGIGFYRFLRDLCDHFDDRAASLEAVLRDLSRRLFVEGDCLLSFAGGDGDLDCLMEAGKMFDRPRAGNVREPGGSAPALVIPDPVFRHEAFIVPSDVAFTAMGFDRRLLGSPYTGAWPVAARALSYDYLWNEVRVHGGAYGAGFQSARTGSSVFYSFRDPHIDETLARFEGAGAWLSSFSPSPAEMEGYIVSTTAGMDVPLKPRELIRRQDGMYFSGYTLDDRRRTRDEIIATTVEDVRARGEVVSRMSEHRLVCAVGDRELIQRSKEGFDVVDILNE